jgi:ring-1,2-phenylacetyl-CoA epoxidase subunit PaaE
MTVAPGQGAPGQGTGDQGTSDQSTGPAHVSRGPASSRRRKSRADFHSLVVANVDPLTDDSAAVSFKVPVDLAEDFAFQAGQFLTVRRGEERRSYSICAPAGAAPRIGVREVADGAVSGWLVRTVQPGDTLEVQVPSGAFTPDLSVPGRHVLIAAGSGITPMMSIAAYVLAADDKSAVTLIYGNRRSDTVMFADEVADLKDAYPARMQLVHVLSREPQEVELFSGRLDRDRLTALLPVTVHVAGVDHWWLCGPFGMVTDAIDVLRELGVEPGRVHRELFWVGDEPPAEATHEDAPAGDGASLTVILDGRSSTLTLPAGTPVLDGAQRARPDLPFACKGGVCGTCRARVTSGSAVMRRNYALEQRELDVGYVLTCQALARTDEITVDYDA